jgi:hypothetical protein
VEHQGRDDVIERRVGEGQRLPKVGEVQGRLGAEPLPGQTQHPGARIDAGDRGAARLEGSMQGTRAASGVEDAATGQVTGQVQDRRTLVVAVDQAVLGLGGVRLGEAVVVVRREIVRRHQPILDRHGVRPGDPDRDEVVTTLPSAAPTPQVLDARFDEASGPRTAACPNPREGPSNREATCERVESVRSGCLPPSSASS